MPAAVPAPHQANGGQAGRLRQWARGDHHGQQTQSLSREGLTPQGAAGRRKEKVLPLPSSLSTQMRPPWASTSPRVM